MTGKIGTPIYMESELKLVETHFSSAVDIYSFTIIANDVDS